MLVEYSDSEGEAEDGPACDAGDASAARLAVVSHSVPQQPKRQVPLSTLQRTGQLPPGFFEPSPNEEAEPDAGGASERVRAPAPKAGSIPPQRGWAGLNAILPPPSQPAKGQFSSASDVLSLVGRGERAVKRPAEERTQPPSTAPGGSNLGSSVGIRLPTDVYNSESVGHATSGIINWAGKSGTREESVTESYEAYSASFAAGGVGYAGGSVGPAPPPAYGAGGEPSGRMGGHEIPSDFYEMAQDGAVMTLSQEELKRSIGPAHHYDIPKPVQDVQISASFWNRKTGQVESGGPKPSKLQKRKHQINSLAQASLERAQELSFVSASGRKSKSETAKKYGW
eukprot:scaffold186274_cov28-Tisochrysis_lutea.AAC.1